MSRTQKEKLLAIIAEDEAPAQKKMLRLLKDIDEIEVVGVASNGIEALDLVQEKHPDILFLDIEMPGLKGTEVVLALQELEHQPYVIFTTAYNTYAVQAFELNAIDYLLKPINKDRLIQAIEKVKSQNFIPPKEVLERFQNSPISSTLEFFPILAGDRYRLIPIEHIHMFEIINKEVHICTEEGEFTITNVTLDAIEKRLPKNRFLRVNRSAIVNLNSVKEIIFWFGSRYKVQLKNDKSIICSREKSKLLREQLLRL